MRALPWFLAAGAVCLLLSVLLASPPATLIDVGAAGDARFLSGFHEAERSGPATFRWAGPDARVVLHGSGAVPLLVGLRVAAQADTRVNIFDQGRLVGVLDVGRGWRPYQVLLPARPGPWPTREARSLTVACDPYFEDQGGRRLGVMVDWIRVEPDPAGERSWEATFGMALVWLSWLCAVGGVAHLVSRRVGARGLQTSLVRVTVLLAILGLAALLARDPYRTAWLLPFTPVTLGLLGLALLVTAGSAGRGKATSPDPSPGREETKDRRGLVLLAGVLLVALGMRFFQLTELPYSLWRDEARHGLVALRLLEDASYRPVYEPRVELPVLGLLPLALGVHLFGIQVWSMRPITALLGALTVLPLYALARRLTARRDLALLASAFLAVSSWHVNLSRLSFPHVFDPLLTLTGLVLLFRGVEQVARPALSSSWLLAAGACFGLALQTYHTGRLSLALGLLLAFLVPQARAARLRVVAPVLMGFLVAGAPLLAYAATHGREFNRRVGTVSLFGHAMETGEAPLAALDASLERHLLMFNVKGDENGRHHAPGRPLLDLVTGLGFAAGVAVLIGGRRFASFESRFLLLALGLYLLPSLLAVDGPHALRSLGTLPFACLTAAVGSEALRHAAGRSARALWLPAILALVQNGWVYFAAMPKDPEVWGAYQPVETKMGLYIQEVAARRSTRDLRDVYVPREIVQSDVFLYLAHGVSVSAWEGASLSRPARPGSLLLSSGLSSRVESRRLARSLGADPEPAILGPVLPDGQGRAFVGYLWP